MRARTVGASAAIAVGLALTMTGCTVNQLLPTYDEVRGETEAAMQAIVDEMPADSQVDDLTDDSPFTCGDAGGVFFTGHWFVHAPDGFDTEHFISVLPELLGPEFVEEEGGIDVSYPLVRLRTVDTAVALDVSESEGDVNILATSRCAQDPAE